MDTQDELIKWMASQLSGEEQAVWNPNNQQNKNFSTPGTSRKVVANQNTMNQILCAQAQDLHQSGMSQQEVPRTNSNSADGTDINMKSPSQSSQLSNSQMEIDQEVPEVNWNSADGTDIYMRSPSQSSRLSNSQQADNIPSHPPGPDVFSYSMGTMDAQSLAQHSPHGQLVWHSAVQPVQYSVPGSRSSTLPSAGLPPTHPDFDLAQELQAPPHPIPHTAGREPYVCHKCGIPGHNIHDCPQKELEPSTPYRGNRLSNARFECDCRQKYVAQTYPGKTVPCPNCGVANKYKKMFKIGRAGPYS